MDYEETVKLLQEYKQFQVMNKGKDTSPDAFLSQKGQAAAFEKLERVVMWYEMYGGTEVSTEEWDELGVILN